MGVCLFLFGLAVLDTTRHADTSISCGMSLKSKSRMTCTRESGTRKRATVRASNVSPHIAEGIVRVLFIPDCVEIFASPGDSLSEVARRAGMEIVESCSVGDCGTCEVMLVDHPSADRIYLKSCITKVPHHKDSIMIDTIGDSIPPWE